MEFTQFISYLDYGVLGLSAIILILSFVLLSREQKREVFRPEVAKAIRRYMMLALAFAGVGLVSTIVDGVMVKPSKAEKKIQDERSEVLTNMLFEDMSKRLDLLNENTIDQPANIIDISVENPSGEQPDVEPEKDSLPKESKPELTEEEEVERVSAAIIAPYYDMPIDTSVMKKSINKIGEKSKLVREHEEELLYDYIKKGKKEEADKE